MNRDAWQRDAELRRLWQVKCHRAAGPADFGSEVVRFFRQRVEKRQRQLGRVAEAWMQLVPQALVEHCALESLTRGALTVLVDSAAHLYELKQLLLAGLQQQLLVACQGSGLRRIVLRRGRWYEGEHPGERRVRFE